MNASEMKSLAEKEIQLTAESWWENNKQLLFDHIKAQAKPRQVSLNCLLE